MKGSRGRERGQSLVEFAVVFPVFMFMVLAMMQMGVILWASNTLNQVVRDTGRYAATVCQLSNAVGSAEARFATLYGDTGGPWQKPTVKVAYTPESGSPACPDDNDDVVWVSVDGSMQAFVFFPLVPGTVTSSTTFRVEPNP